MALRPEDRYASPAALADDIERWLADEPVSAYREPARARAARWGRRHRTWVAAMAVLLVTSTIGLAASTVLIRAEKLRTERQKARTEQSFRENRAAIREFLAIADSEKSPESQPLRKKILLAAKGHYEKFLEDHSGDPDIQSELASTHFQIAEILLATGLGVVGETGDEARRNNVQASSIYETLARRHPDVTKYREYLELCSAQLDRLEEAESQASISDPSLRLFFHPEGIILPFTRKS